MASLALFNKVQLFTGVIYNATVCLTTLYQDLEHYFNNSITLISDRFAFDHSTYYNTEMGDSLNRIFIGFETLISPEQASHYKVLATTIENKYLSNKKRNVNIDPGILSLHNLILFSTKNFSHRIPCSQGIYAELTLLYQKNQFQALDWTYPDFKQTGIQTYFLTLRHNYHQKLNQETVNHD